MVEDPDIERKEQAPAPDTAHGAYCTAIRNGMCNAYLAAKAVASRMVSSSTTGAMGTVSCVDNLYVFYGP